MGCLYQIPPPGLRELYERGGRQIVRANGIEDSKKTRPFSYSKMSNQSDPQFAKF